MDVSIVDLFLCKENTYIGDDEGFSVLSLKHLMLQTLMIRMRIVVREWQNETRHRIHEVKCSCVATWSGRKL